METKKKQDYKKENSRESIQRDEKYRQNEKVKNKLRETIKQTKFNRMRTKK